MTKQPTMSSTPGLSIRFKLACSYVGLLVLAGTLLLAVVWVFLLRYVPAEAVVLPGPGSSVWGDQAPRLHHLFIPGRGDLWKAFAPRAAMAMGVLLVFSLIGGWFLAGYMLRPVQQIADAARLAAQGSLSHRVNLVGHNDEFGELADTFDMMLARLETHVDEYRRFAANASHELRTPLATAQSMLDVALRNPNRDIDQLLQRLHQVNARSIALTEALLTLSRADQRSFTPEPVDLSLLVEESMELLLPFAEQRGVNIETASAVTLASGSRTLLGQLTTNLLHNAIVHNYPTEGTVKVATAVVGGLAALTVENTGNLLDPQLVATLTQPFQRGTQRARSGTPGHGLGLAIVQSIVQAHKGTLILTPQVQGGLRVTVQLPVNQSS